MENEMATTAFVSGLALRDDGESNAKSNRNQAYSFTGRACPVEPRSCQMTHALSGRSNLFCPSCMNVSF